MCLCYIASVVSLTAELAVVLTSQSLFVCSWWAVWDSYLATSRCQQPTTLTLLWRLWGTSALASGLVSSPQPCSWLSAGISAVLCAYSLCSLFWLGGKLKFFSPLKFSPYIYTSPTKQRHFLLLT